MGVADVGICIGVRPCHIGRYDGPNLIEVQPDNV